MGDNLKPCPFCGNRDIMIHACEYEKKLWIISCRGCQCEYTVARVRSSRKGKDGLLLLKSNHDAVVDGWNRRADTCKTKT